MARSSKPSLKAQLHLNAQPVALEVVVSTMVEKLYSLLTLHLLKLKSHKSHKHFPEHIVKPPLYAQEEEMKKELMNLRLAKLPEDYTE